MAIRNEAVRLTLIDDFTTPMAKAAVASRALDKALKDLDSSQVQSAKASAKTTAALEKQAAVSPKVSATTKRLSGDLDGAAKSADRADNSINQLTGRLSLLADVVAILGPSLAPIGAVGVAGIAGLANQVGVAALGAGTLLLAFQGVGDAMKAVSQARLEPTVKNLEAARAAMENLSPAAREAASAMRAMGPTLKGIQGAGAEGFFPGFIEALAAIESRAPDAERIVGALGGALGDITTSGARALADSEWDEFFDFLATDARDTLVDLGESLGNLARGFAELWMASDPLSDDFSSWMKDATADFASWADGLSETQGFQDFVAYIRENGPQVGETFAAIADAVLQVVEASAPLGGPVLAGIEAVASTIAAVADSDLGTPIMLGVGALALLNRGLALTASISSRLGPGGLMGGIAGKGGAKSFKADLAAMSYGMVGLRANMEHTAGAADRMKGRLATAGKGAALIGGLGVAASGAAEGFGLANTATLAMAGAMAGPWGAAIGGGIGLMLDFNASLGENSAVAKEAEQAALSLGEAYLGTLDVMTGLATASSEKFAWDYLGADAAAEMEKVGVSAKEYIAALTSGDAQAAKEMAATLLMSMSGEGGVSEETISRVSRLQEGVEAGTKAYEEHATVAEMSGRAAEEAAAREAAALQETINKLRTVTDERLRASSATIAFKAAISDASKAAKENGQTLDLNTDKGQANQGALDALAGSWNELNRTGKATPGAYAEARRAFIQTATQMGATGEQARRMAGKILDIPEKRLTKLQLQGVDMAVLAAQGLKAALADLKDREIRVTTIYRSQGSAKRNDMDFGTGSAEGGTVPTTGLGYADRHPYLLADGEEVISNRYGQADRNRALLKAINQNRLADGGTVGRLANGGTAGGKKDGKPKPRDIDMLTAWGEGLTHGLKGLSRGIQGLERAASRAEDALNAEATARDAIKGQYDDLASAMGGRFNSDPFDQSKNPFLASSLGSLDSMRADTESASAILQAIPKLKEMGLTGGALETALRGASPEQIQAMLGNQEWVSAYQQQYGIREEVNTALGKESAEALYGQQLTAANASYARQEAELKRIKDELKEANRLSAIANKALEDQPKNIGHTLAQPVKGGKKNAGRK